VIIEVIREEPTLEIIGAILVSWPGGRTRTVAAVSISSAKSRKGRGKLRKGRGQLQQPQRKRGKTRSGGDERRRGGEEKGKRRKTGSALR
jgi:hypothetical protein